MLAQVARAGWSRKEGAGWLIKRKPSQAHSRPLSAALCVDGPPSTASKLVSRLLRVCPQLGFASGGPRASEMSVPGLVRAQKSSPAIFTPAGPPPPPPSPTVCLFPLQCIQTGGASLRGRRANVETRRLAINGSSNGAQLFRTAPRWRPVAGCHNKQASRK